MYRTLFNNRSIGPSVYRTLFNNRSIGPSVYKDSPKFLLTKMVSSYLIDLAVGAPFCGGGDDGKILLYYGTGWNIPINQAPKQVRKRIYFSQIDFEFACSTLTVYLYFFSCDSIPDSQLILPIHL